MRDDFTIFIASHSRAGDIPTLRTLKKSGYTGDWYIVIDNEEDKEPYYDEYGEDNVIYYDKDEVIDDIDRMDNFDNRNCILYFRYHTFQIAKDLGYDYFLQLDDDYGAFEWKFDSNYEYGYHSFNDYAKSFDELIEETINFLEDSGLHIVCMAQTGDFIGGDDGSMGKQPKTKRKAMNSQLCKVDNPINFRGTMNEDVNAYIREQQLGKTMLTYNFLCVNQENTQEEAGGMSDIYDEKGTYVKSFYTVMISPSSTKLMQMGVDYQRIHHRIEWRNAVPKIISDEYKKRGGGSN